VTAERSADDVVHALSSALLTMAHRDERTPCQGRYSELWLSEDYTQRAETIPLCAGCELITKCADYATELKASFGVWAGVDRTPTTRKERPMTPATILTAIPNDILRAGDGHNERQRQAIRLARYFEQRGHRPTWAELSQERARRANAHV